MCHKFDTIHKIPSDSSKNPLKKYILKKKKRFLKIKAGQLPSLAPWILQNLLKTPRLRV